MPTHPTKSAQDAAWTQVLRFRVSKDDSGPSPETVRLFKNQRQRCAIQVEVVVGDQDAFPVAIGIDEIKARLRLVHYTAQAPELGTNNDGYAQYFDPGDYVWDESILLAAERFADEGGSTGNDVARAATRSRNEPSDTCTVYVQASPSATNKRVGARFLLPDGASYAYTTHSQVDDPNGDGDGNGLFNSSVNIQPVGFPTLPVGNYGDVASDGTLIATPVGTKDAYYWAEEHFLHVNLNGYELELKSVGAAEGGTTGFAAYKRSSGVLAPVLWGISYHSQPGSDVAESLPLAPLHHLNVAVRPDTSESPPARIEDPKAMYNNCVGTIENADSYKVVIGLLQGKTFPVTFETSANGSVSDVAKTTLHIMDVYGNDHALSLTLQSEPNKIRLAKA